MPYLTFNDVLEKAGITNFNRVLLIRHPITKLYDRGYKDSKHRDEYIKAYTACQSKIHKGRYDYWAVFIGTQGTLGTLFRIYKVCGVEKITKSLMPEGYSHEEEYSESCDDAFFYKLEEVDSLQEYYGRLVIDWGAATRKWYQIAGRNQKPIVALMDNKKEPFPGYENVLLSYSELFEMVNDPISYEAWHSALSSVYGIYLNVNKKEKDGRQYIGSATGENGILGRWTDYANNHTGGDKLLIELMEKEPKSYEHFQFTILRIIPKETRKDDVIEIESLYKRKLGSRVFGLNAN